MCFVDGAPYLGWRRAVSLSGTRGHYHHTNVFTKLPCLKTTWSFAHGQATLEVNLRLLSVSASSGRDATPSNIRTSPHVPSMRKQIPCLLLHAGEADVRATIKKRAPCSAKYAAHLVVPASPPYKEAATVVGPHHVATYAHEGHSSWQCEQTVPVR